MASEPVDSVNSEVHANLEPLILLATCYLILKPVSVAFFCDSQIEVSQLWPTVVEEFGLKLSLTRYNLICIKKLETKFRANKLKKEKKEKERKLRQFKKLART